MVSGSSGPPASPDRPDTSGDPEPSLLTTRQVADQLHMTEGTLRNWRSMRHGPHFITNPDTGLFIGYTQQAIKDWLDRGKCRLCRLELPHQNHDQA